MRLLKVVLYSILITCFAWGALIFSGPTIIELFLKKSFGDSVKLSGLNVSPNLSVHASRLEMENAVVANFGTISGFVRSLSLTWGDLLTGDPFINFSVGPSTLKGWGSFEKIDLQFRHKNMSNIKVEAVFKGLISPTRGDISDLSINAIYDRDENKFFDINFTGEAINYSVKPRLKTKSFFGSIDNIKPFETLTIDNLPNSTIVFENFAVVDEGIVADQISLGVLDRSGSGVIDLSVAGAQLGKGIYIKEIQVDGSYESDYSYGDFNFLFEQIKIKIGKNYLFDGRIPFAKGSVLWRDQGETSLALNGQVDNMEVMFDTQFISNLKSSSFKLGADFSYNDGLRSEFFLTPSSSSLLSFAGNTNTKVLGGTLLQCLQHGCQYGDSEIIYELKTSKALLSGKSYCPSSNCESSSSLHSILTDDTDLLFTDLIASQVFSPLVAAAMFTQIKSSEKRGKGHQFNF